MGSLAGRSRRQSTFRLRMKNGATRACSFACDGAAERSDALKSPDLTNSITLAKSSGLFSNGVPLRHHDRFLGIRLIADVILPGFLSIDTSSHTTRSKLHLSIMAMSFNTMFGVARRVPGNDS